MTEKNLKEAKSFRAEMRAISIFLWIIIIAGTSIGIYLDRIIDVVDMLCLFSFGAIVFSVIWFNMNYQIRNYEKNIFKSNCRKVKSELEQL